MVKLRYTTSYGDETYIESSMLYQGNRIYLQSLSDIASVQNRYGYYNDDYTVTAKLYSDNSGQLGELLVTGDTLNVSSGAVSLKTFSLSASSLSAGYYWVVFFYAGLASGKYGKTNSGATSTLNTEVPEWSNQSSVSVVYQMDGFPAGYGTIVLPGFTVNGTAAASLSKPTTPTPANASGPGIDFSDFTLSWQDGGGAESYRVYLGDSPYSLNLYSSQAGTSYTPEPGSLAHSFILAVQGVIYWRVDAVAGEDAATGDVWSFDPRPAKAGNPTPADTATDQRLNVPLLSWDAADEAGTYDVHFTGYLAPISVDQVGVTCGVPDIPLDYATLYTWRVDSRNEFGTTTGDEWTFTTLSFDPPRPVFRLKADGSLASGPFDPDTMYRTGENFVTGGVGRLVAITEIGLWYEEV